MPNELEGGSQNPPVAEEQPASKENIGNIVNAAVTNHLKRIADKQQGAIDAALKPILERIEKLSAAPTPAPEDSDAKKKAGVDPQIAALQQQLEDFKRQAQESEQKRVAAEKKAREDRAFSDLRTELGKHVRPEMLDVVSNHLFKIQGAVEIDDDGNATFKSRRVNFGVEEDVLLPLKDGVEQYVKSEAAKPFIPSPGTSNTPQVKKNQFSSSRPSGPVDLSKASPEQKIQAAEELKQKFQQALANQGRRA